MSHDFNIRCGIKPIDLHILGLAGVARVLIEEITLHITARSHQTTSNGPEG